MIALAPSAGEQLERVRRRTEELIAPLDDAALSRQAAPIMSPPVWDLGHIAAYEELWILQRVAGRASLHPELQAVYDAFETPRARRSEVPILDPPAARDYLRRVREGTLEVLGDAEAAGDDPLLEDGFVFRMVAEHEAQHSETVLQALQLLDPGAYLPPRRTPPPAAPGAAPAGEWVTIPGGQAEIGAPADGFAYDCERPRHRRPVAGVRIARDPVTAGDQIAFISDGGYRTRSLWSDEGWEWVRREGVRAPLYWEPDGAGGWTSRCFDRVAEVDPSRPLCHVSAHEADAHARWAGARLPSEFEWERAAAGASTGPAAANLDQLAFGTVPVGSLAGSAPSGCRQMMGDVWEWTCSTLAGYPGFRAFPYREYSEVFFGRGHRVLRGGSWATQPIAARASFRNWDLPERRQIFAGLRLARDLA